MKVKDLIGSVDPDAIIAIRSLNEAFPVKSIGIDEGIYDSQEDNYILLSENNLTDLEEKYCDGDGLDFVSLVILNV